jgi:general stress protein 26
VVSRDNQIDHVWNLADKIGACMLVTMSGRGLRARPMHALPDREGGCLWFITDQRGAKDDEIKAAPDVCRAFADTRSNGYLSITGRAEVLHDVAKATALWSNEAQAWWPKGPTDPDAGSSGRDSIRSCASAEGDELSKSHMAEYVLRQAAEG